MLGFELMTSLDKYKSPSIAALVTNEMFVTNSIEPMYR